MEIWKPVKNYEGLYEVSNKGRIRSLDRKCKAGSSIGTRNVKSCIKIAHFENGYLRVQLYKDNKKKNCKVHRLVAEAFIPNPKNLPEVNHKDFNKTNNSVDNLEWVTPKENSNHYLNKFR